MFAALQTDGPLEHVWVLDGDVRDAMEPVEQLTEREPGQDALDALARIDVDPDELCCLLLSGGTTGTPKLAAHSHNTIMAFGEAVAGGANCRDRILDLAPSGGGMGTGGATFQPLHAGATVVYPDTWDPDEILELAERERVTMIHTVPPIMLRLLKSSGFEDRDLGAVRLIFTGGAAMPPSGIRAAEERVEAFLVSCYGATDAGFAARTLPQDPAEKRYGTAGSPGHLRGTTLRLLDDNGQEVAPGEAGLVAVRSPGTFLGYYADPDLTHDAFTSDGFCIAMSDLAVLGDDGYLRLVGRRDDMILRGGTNIHPKEIADALMAYPPILDAAIVGFPDEELGERLCAFVSLADPGGPPVTLDELRDHLSAQGFVRHKLPERLEVRNSIRTDGGKISSSQLRAELRGS